jgi:hypothetical protein
MNSDGTVRLDPHADLSGLTRDEIDAQLTANFLPIKMHLIGVPFLLEAVP